MTFAYAYRDRNNERHDGTIVASSKDDAFRKLKAQGIKPFYIALAPGLLNRIQSFGKRGIAIGILLILVAASLAGWALSRKEAKELLVVVSAESEFNNSITSQLRRQLIGDAAIIDEGIRTGWASVFEAEGDRFLASFAIPGVPAGVRATSEGEISAALARKVEPTAEDSLEARQIKSMVEGMKNELRKFLAAGGSIARYGTRLVQRQEEEIGYYQRAKLELDRAKKANKPPTDLNAIVNRYNPSLRSMGIRPITVSE